MNARFCPDCGAECLDQDESCRECHFPLVLRMLQNEGEVAVPRHELNNWNRIAQVLRRNGIRIVLKATPRVSSKSAWLFLPGFGLLIFLSCLVFGEIIADSIWGRPVQAAAPILDLAKKNATGSDSEGEGEEAESNVDMTFLKDALKANDSQRFVDHPDESSSNLYEKKPAISHDEVLKIAESRLVLMRVGIQDSKGIYIGSDQVLTNAESLEHAFKRGSRIVKNKDGYQRVTEMLIPELMFPGKPAVKGELEILSDELGVALMNVALPQSSSMTLLPLSYQEPLSVGQKLWACTYISGKLYLEAVSISEEVPWGENRTLFKLDKGLGSQNAGTPLFSESGEVVALLLIQNGEELVLSFLSLREQGPQLFKAIRVKS